MGYRIFGELNIGVHKKISVWKNILGPNIIWYEKTNFGSENFLGRIFFCVQIFVVKNFRFKLRGGGE